MKNEHSEKVFKKVKVSEKSSSLEASEKQVGPAIIIKDPEAKNHNRSEQIAKSKDRQEANAESRAVIKDAQLQESNFPYNLSSQPNGY